MQKPKIIYYRRLFQVVGLVFLALIPILDLFRFDLGNNQFLLLGQRFFIHQLYLPIIMFVILMIVLIFFSRIFGRIWCGWLCPQNTWAELGDYLSALAHKQESSVSKFLKLTISVLVAFCMILFFSFVLMAVFVDPKELWKQAATGNIGGFVGISLVKLTVFGFANMLVIRHSFCWNICPYAMLQKVLANSGTLRIIFNLSTCVDCKGCEKVCTMKLRPRYLDKTQDVTNCINCGQCIKACNVQAQPRGVDSSLSYAFGKEGKASKDLVVPDKKVATVGLLLIMLTFGFVMGFVNHKGIDVSLSQELREEVAIRGEWVENHYLLRLRTTVDYDAPIRIQVVGLSEDSTVTPEVINPSGKSEELIKVSVKTKAESLDRSLMPIQFLISSQGNKDEFFTEIKASFYYFEGGGK